MNLREGWPVLCGHNPLARVRGSKRLAWPLVLASTLSFVVLVSSCSAALGSSQAEQKYLDAMHNPCHHPEIFTNVRDGHGAYCEFVWSGDDHAQVAEGHEICAIEKRQPAAIYEAPFAYLQARHPDYSRIQINTEMIAAEQTLCRS